MLFENLTGNTPLIPLPCQHATLLAKMEWKNPAGSVKDRVALSMLRAARKNGLLKPGGTIIEATSGNTGIALAALAAAGGYGCIIVMPENMSRERQQLLDAYGARIILSPAADGMAGAAALAKQLAQQMPESYYADQFQNPANPAAHYAATGPEIWTQAKGNVDIFVAGVGTGGTITGVGRYLKQQRKDIRIVAVEPAPGQKIPGIGAGFRPPILDETVIDEWIAVTREQAVAAAQSLERQSGLLPGISAGAALHAAGILSDRSENRSRTIVTLLPDSGERYLSTGCFVR